MAFECDATEQNDSTRNFPVPGSLNNHNKPTNHFQSVIDLLNDKTESCVIILWTKDVEQEIDSELESASRHPTATPVEMIRHEFAREARVT